MGDRIYIVATNDVDLKRRLRKIPGVPIMSCGNGKYVTPGSGRAGAYMLTAVFPEGTLSSGFRTRRRSRWAKKRRPPDSNLKR